MPAPQKETQAKGEREVKTKYFREFKGIYTKAQRVACPENNFYDLVNLIPIGHGNLHTVPDISSALVDYATDTIYWIQYANINSTDYLIAFASNGKVFAYNIVANTSAQINVGSLLSGAGSRMDQWKNSLILFADSTGYYSWDGTTFAGPYTGGTSTGLTVVSGTVSGSTGTILFQSSPSSLYNGAIVQLSGFTPSGWNGKWAVTQMTLPAVSSALVNTAFTLGTITFASTHNLATGALVTLSGFTSSGWNGIFTATVTGANTITIPFTAAPIVTLPSISTGTASGTTCTLTFATPHGLVTGQYITLFNMNPTGWNGQWQVTVTNSTQVTFTDPGSPGNATSPYGSAVVSSATVVGTATVGNMWQITFSSPPTNVSVVGTALGPGLLPQNTVSPYAQTLTSPDIAVFSNRVWIYSNRALYVSAINSYTDFTLVDGSIVQNLTDPQLRGQLTRMMSCNGYLYLLGNSSSYVISDVYIPSGASPPAPVFSILNVQAIIGCDQPGSVFPYNRDLMFANSYGLWRLTGVTAEKISADIDGTIQYVNTVAASGGLQISGGTPQVYNLLQASFLMQQTGDPTFGTRTIVANYFDNKWWFANYDALTFVTTGLNANAPVLFGMKGNKLYQLYQNTSSAPASSWQTALWAMDDSLADKEVLRSGFEMVVTTINSITSNIDTPNSTAQFYPPSWNSTASVGATQWINNSSSIVSWQNNSLSTVTWYSGSYLLYVGDGLGSYAKYVGTSGAATAGSVYELSSIMFDYSLRKRW